MDASIRHLLCFFFSLFFSGLYHLMILAALAFVRKEKRKLSEQGLGWVQGWATGVYMLLFTCVLARGLPPSKGFTGFGLLSRRRSARGTTLEVGRGRVRYWIGEKS